MSLRIVFLGDSFVNGTGDPEYLGWAGRACHAARARGHDLTAYNLGIRRDTSADVAGRWAQETERRLPAEFPAALVFSFGVNDCVAVDGRLRVPPDRTLENLRAILHAAKSRAPCLMVGPPPTADAAVNERVAGLCPRMAAQCEALGVPYLATYTPLLESRNWIAEAEAADGAHPGAGGYAELAVMVDGWPAWRDLLP